jgi:tetratricopeptide (TPR) repeat protein
MNGGRRCLAVMGLALVLGVGWAWAQADDEISRMMVESYDLMEAGKLDLAQEIYAQVLEKEPGNPLALNNLGAIMVKRKHYDRALTYLGQALNRAKGYKVMVNRVCDADGICLAFRPVPTVYGNQDLEPLVRLNLELIKTKLAEGRKQE